MNIVPYIFGKLNSGYTQYPDDYSRAVFSVFERESQAVTQVIIHRDNDLMYYGYIRKLEGNCYIGLCTVINGKYITQVGKLFSIYEEVIELMVRNGYLIHFNDKGEIVSKVNAIYENKDEIDLIFSSLHMAFDRLEGTSDKLPPVSYGVSKDAIRNFTRQDAEEDILRSSYTNGYTFLYKPKDYNTAQMNSYRGVICRKESELSRLRTECNELKKQVSSLKNKQRNTLWVSIFAIAALILGVIVWTQVIFPSEVTKKDMGEFVYYGPMKDGKPNGVGVAIYPPNDPDGRRYYIGNFRDGVREDKEAMLYYNNGNYFYGSMKGDKWEEGIMYIDSDNSHFKGIFVDNEPYDGTWYDHKKAYDVKP